MLKIQDQRPSALSAVCAPVSELPSLANALTAHAPVGYGAVATLANMAADGTTLAQPQAQQLQAQQLQAQRRMTVEGTGVQGATIQGATIHGIAVFTVKQSVIDMDPVGGVRGIPPRGRPV